jgi:membrane fusion protein, heavy metal efflux system
MNALLDHFVSKASLLALNVVLAFLLGCSSGSEAPVHAKAPVLPNDEVLLAPDSSKRAMIVETVLDLVPAPIMEPVAGKIAYDETVTARISAPVTGRIVSQLPILGAKVNAHDPLLELDSPELGKAKEGYANALADARLAEGAYERAKSLFEHGVLPHKELQEAENTLTHARDDVSQGLMHLHNLGATDQQINNRYWVRSPIAGIVTERHVNPGLEVRPDLADPLFVVSDLSRLWVYMNVFEKDIGLIHVGSQVSVSVVAYPNHRFPAVVEYIDKLVDETTRSIKVRCRVANDDGKLLPAMYASIDVQSGPDDRALVIPLTALFTEGEGDQVFVKIGDGHYKQREVVVRLRMKDRAVIAEGLVPGETIVSEGALLLRTEEANEQSESDSLH